MKVIHASPTVLAAVLKCETAAWTRHVKGYTSPGEAIKATAGQAFHAAIAEYLRPAPLNDVGRAVATFHEIYDPAFARLSAEKLEPSLTPTNLHKILERWIEMHPESQRPWRKVLMVEEAFCSREWTFGNATVRLICRPDIVVEDEFGCARWVDTKTTGWRIADPGWRKNLKLSLQSQLYTDAVLQRFGAQSVVGGWFSAIELGRIPSDPTKTCQTHRGQKYAECGPEHVKAEFIEALTSEHRIAAALRDAEYAAQRLVALHSITDPAELDMRGTSNGACRFCPAGDWCLADRVPEALSGFMHYEPWPVEEGVRA